MRFVAVEAFFSREGDCSLSQPDSKVNNGALQIQKRTRIIPMREGMGSESFQSCEAYEASPAMIVDPSDRSKNTPR